MLHVKRISALAVACTLLASCTVRRAQTTVQSSLTSVAVAVDAVDNIVADEILEASEEAVEASLQVPNGREHYSSLMEPWEEAVIGLEATVEALHLVQAATTIWIQSGDVDNNTVDMCAAVGEAIESLIGLLEAVGVEVPETLSNAVEGVPVICQLIAEFVRE